MWRKWHKNRLWQNGRDRPNDWVQIKSFGCAMCVPVRACVWYDFGDFILVFSRWISGPIKSGKRNETAATSNGTNDRHMFRIVHRWRFDRLCGGAPLILSLCHSSDANVIVVCASDQCTVWWNSRISNSLRIAYLLKNKCNLSSQSLPLLTSAYVVLGGQNSLGTLIRSYMYRMYRIHKFIPFQRMSVWR